ncbi:unnamed protein product [Acanthoscelides obtectus]|uniref:Uncharacterized protein n=2 Tax=Acanthoscelides obtectus TaxID=200917 RepID=A0A9P0PMV8_ACAOB|nr:unnamed protein product [Acanthoscelides obtectus]CAK1669828.1 Calpain-B [Acanthoscelides obtectus]
MWKAFLDRTSESCGVITAPQVYYKRKTDLMSVEYRNYIQKDVLSCLDQNLKMHSKLSKPSNKRTELKKEPPVYFKSKKVGESKPGACLHSEECKCGKKCSLKPKGTRGDDAGEKNDKKTVIISPRKPISPQKSPRPCQSEEPLVLHENVVFIPIEEGTQYLVKDIKSVQLCKKPKCASNRSSMQSERGKQNSERSVQNINRETNEFLLKLLKFGEKGSGFRVKSGEPQDFYKLRDQCSDRGELFEDPEFPATDSSLFFSRRPDRYYEWRRPHEIADNPQFFVEGFSRFDVQQGELGDCWLLAAAANLTLYKRLFFQIVPDDQDFDDKYAGIFHFRFWQYGKWVDVVIDDRLPTYQGQLVFLHSTEDNEFWSALLEKAYAKLHGSYEALKGGSTCEAMEDFTGGVTEMYEMEACPPNLFQIIIKAYERSSLMGCSIEPDPNVLEAQTPEGLIRGHAYSITCVRYVDISTPNVSGKIPLLRLRNPWGNESEWNGAWSDGAPEWRFISEAEKEELGLTFDNDGEFWMSFKDYQRHFSRLEICNLNPDSLSEEELLDGHKKKWEMSVFEGEWVRGVTAGGCRNFLDSFWHNPQYRITLTEVDEGEDEDLCTMIVALMQKNRRQIRNTGADLLTIGFALYYLPHPDRVPKPLDLNFFKYNASVARSPSFINLREVTCRFKLPPGTYCIVPSTFDPNEEGEFLLRVFSEKANIMEENDEKVGLAEVDQKVVPQEPTEEEQEETNKIYELFLQIAKEDKEVDWRELKQILDFILQPEMHINAFSKDICRSMIAMLDEDRSGKLGYKEFRELYEMIIVWKNVWIKYDTDNSGSFSGFELREALNSAGFKLNSRILNILMHRYGGKNGEIHFDDFMMCAIKLKTMIDIFKEKDADDTDSATFSMEKWLEYTLYT